jgi:hypothetical protein
LTPTIITAFWDTISSEICPFVVSDCFAYKSRTDIYFCSIPSFFVHFLTQSFNEWSPLRLSSSRAGKQMALLRSSVWAEHSERGPLEVKSRPGSRIGRMAHDGSEPWTA